MVHYRNNGIGVKLVRKKRYQEDLTIEPIYWQITYKRKSRLYSTGFSFSAEEWNDVVNKQLRKHKGFKDTTQGFFDKTLRPLIDDFAENNSFSFEVLEDKLEGKENETTDETISVNKAFENKIASLVEEFKIGNASLYKTTLNALVRFKHYKSLKSSKDRKDFTSSCIEKKNITVGKNVLTVDKAISFDEITPQFLEECEKFWLETSITYATISLYMRTLRSIINNSEGAEPYLSGAEYPFGIKRGKYAIPEGGRREIALPIEAIWKVEDYETDNETLATARDIFVFMFYCNGLNYGDLCRLRYANIDAPSEEIIFQRKKTLRKGEAPTFIYAPMLPPMVEIINRQGNKNQKGYIFPFLNGIEPVDENESKIKNTIRLTLDPINSSLKTIAKELELDPNLSTSYTRNSYVSHLTNELLISPIVLRKMIGHSTKKDVTAGYVNLNAKKRREMNLKLLNPKKKYTTINSGKSAEVG
jgi:integrase